MNNSIQYDNNNIMTNQQPTTMFNQQPTTMFNQPSIYPDVGNNDMDAIQQYDTMLLNGTNLDDELNYNSNQINTSKQDSTLIKSVAREIINGLKENNMSLYDNSSINSYNNPYNKNDNDNNNYSDCENDNDDDNLNKSSKKFKNSKIKNKVKKVVETIEDFVTDTKSINSTKTYSESAWWFFDECFNYKDFLVLFILYFTLSQEMIKDFFARYFTSLNPDNEGKIGVQGVIIYGLILTILYMIIKKLF